MTTISTLEFLQALYPDPVSPGQLVVWTSSKRSGKKRSYWLGTLDEAARQAQRLKRSRDVYFGVALQDPQAALAITRCRWPRVQLRSVRGSEDSVVALPALWADIDVAGPGHASGTLPPDRQAAFELLAAVPVPPSIIVNSGGGYHVYWLLRELWHLETEDERRQAKNLLLRLQGALRREAQTKGWMVDHTADLARVLRLPGTLNQKATRGVPVRVEQFPLVTTVGSGTVANVARDARYNPQDFDALPEPPSMPDPGVSLLGSRDDTAPADFEPIYHGCAWIRHCYADRAGLPEPEWYATVGIAGRSASGRLDGRQLVHKYSEGHSGYNPLATDEKLEHALRSPGPHTCQQIAHRLGAYQDYCRQCPHFGHIKSPIVLGRLGQRSSGVADVPAPVEVEMEPKATAAAPSAVVGVDVDVGVEHCGSSGDRKGGTKELPQILVNTREHEVNDQALRALASREENLFERAGVLVHVVRQGHGCGLEAASVGEGEPGCDPESCEPECEPECQRLRPAPRSASRPAASSVVRPVQEARIRELLARCCTFVTPKKTARSVALRPVHPPRWTVRALIARGSWPELPVLEGLVECPVLRADGTVLQSPGYDVASGLVYAPSDRFEPVPDKPSAGQVEEALIHLREVVCNFPFQAEAHFSAWLSALLTPLARPAFEGPSPHNLIDANIRGSGKSLLADVCSTLLTGRSAARMSYSNDEDEIRKAITGIALEATQLVLIDNISGAFGSPTLDRALTAETWRDRLLGTNDQVSIPLRVTWFATGNNVVLTGDTPRRCQHIRLESALERPEQRTDFRHPRLLTWLRRERPRLLPAALTLLRAYVTSGRPNQHLSGWGSYEEWSDLVRSAVVWLGLPDPAETREDLEADSDTELSVLHDLIYGLAELLETLGGVATTKEILEKLSRNSTEEFTLLRSALSEHFPRLRDGDLPRTTQLACHLRTCRGRIVHGACIDQQAKSYRGVRWTVRQVEPTV